MTNTFDKDRVAKIKRAISDEFAVAIAEFYLDGTQVTGRLEYTNAALKAGADNANVIGIRSIECHPLGSSTGIRFSIPGNDFQYSIWLDFIPASAYLIQRDTKQRSANSAATRAETIRLIKGTAWLIAFGVACVIGIALVTGQPILG